MDGHKDNRASFPDLPSEYWSTLTHHNHHSSPSLALVEHLEHLGVNSDSHDAAYFKDFAYGKSRIAPSTRTCSSLLSEMLRPAPDSQPTSPSTTHNEMLSDHGDHVSYSTHSTPPLQATPPKRPTISFGIPATTNGVQVLHAKAPNLHSVESPSEVAPTAVRHISFGGVTRTDSKISNDVDVIRPKTLPACVKDAMGGLTPTVKRTIQFAARSDIIRTTSDSSGGLDDDGASQVPRPRSIKFAGSNCPLRSQESSRRSSYTDAHHSMAGPIEEALKSHAAKLTSPLLSARPPAHPTCKSTLDAMLKKEAIAKVIDTVPEEEDEYEEDDLDEEIDEDEEEDLDTNSMSVLDLDSDDDGYQEDIESDDDISEPDSAPYTRLGSDTPRKAVHCWIDSHSANAMRAEETVRTPVYRTAAPSESDLPDTTDFAPGTIDEDQPACIAFGMAVRDRKARREPAKPSDIDPTFPESGSDEDPDMIDLDLPSAKLTENGRPICRSPPMHHRTGGRQRLHSPPIAKPISTTRATSLPRRYLTGRKGLYAPKPPRAVTIKQSNEKRAERRREKKELRHDTRRGKAEVDHNGHEKMKVHCLSRKKLIASENPCVIRPVMSI